MKRLLYAAVAVAMMSCAAKKEQTAPVPDIKEWIDASGTVTAIEYGKDGYTATLKTDNNLLYLVTISHANLKNAVQYKSVKIGDKLNVSGDGWGTAAEKHITVREIKP